MECKDSPQEFTVHSAPYGFANSEHVDKCDELSKALIYYYEWWKRTGKKIGKRNANVYLRRLMKYDGFCLPTTCGYQFVFESDQDELGLVPVQYFTLDGLGLAVRVKHGMGHHFLGAAFAHRTCLCLCELRKDSKKRYNDKRIYASNSHDNFQVFAWGRSGGSPQVAHAEGINVQDDAFHEAFLNWYHG